MVKTAFRSFIQDWNSINNSAVTAGRYSFAADLLRIGFDDVNTYLVIGCPFIYLEFQIPTNSGLYLNSTNSCLCVSKSKIVR